MAWIEGAGLVCPVRVARSRAEATGMKRPRDERSDLASGLEGKRNCWNEEGEQHPAQVLGAVTGMGTWKEQVCQMRSRIQFKYVESHMSG